MRGESRLPMKNLIQLLLEKFSKPSAPVQPEKKAQSSLRCKFCGELGHEEDTCPNASKYKLFNVDRD
jgi:hypothetical protein